MSRTFRHIPFWCRKKSKQDKTWEGIDPLYTVGDYYVRDDLFNGFDNKKADSNYYTAFPGSGWTENFRGKTRKFFKRAYAKGRRRSYAKSIFEQLVE